MKRRKSTKGYIRGLGAHFFGSPQPFADLVFAGGFYRSKLNDVFCFDAAKTQDLVLHRPSR
ncbi:MAG: hypothetical protein JKX88_11725, partial [Marinicaulis sp.]|nr:hypothetical protein [Marinicaulis sp.]